MSSSVGPPSSRARVHSLAAGPSPDAPAGAPGGPASAGVPPASVPAPRASAAGREGASGGRFRWPLPGAPRVVRRFDPPPRPWLSGHRGVDLAAAPGTPVLAAGAGTVLFAGTVAGRPVLTVGHSDGLRTTYEPVRSGLTAGTPVDTGTPVGELLAGHQGCAEAACLHWGLRRDAEYLDPLALLGLGRVRLLPLHPVPGSPADVAE
ncbi:M23 family metallopeptidase [Micromonospora sp. WMMD1076]|uniref:murein hydrolase activator EnvC family protein n=1 Tax=Micromonospora sp. WMMD1076 TaxID=3016103 RepID=UPI00249AC191|nr:M23 family metallopeptidase [Micromonospora sp. WMMD1076]WFF09973.1 M23 family metallopeptidase [Micromonospora sp. WMMD1076]